MLEPRDFLGIAVDPVRLAVLGHAAVAPLDVPALATALGLPERKVQEVVGKLVMSGLLTDDLRLDRDALRALAQRLLQDAPADPELIARGWSEDEARTLSRFFTGSRLKQIPSSRSKRLVVLERLAQEFEPSYWTIREWIRQADIDEGKQEGLSTDEKEELTRLRRENRQLKLEREILSKAAAWFARETDSVPPKSSDS